jgi:hypothetical protein
MATTEQWRDLLLVDDQGEDSLSMWELLRWFCWFAAAAPAIAKPGEEVARYRAGAPGFTIYPD